MIVSAIVYSPKQPWSTYNIIFMLMTIIHMSFFVIIGTMSIYFARNDLLTFVELAHAYSFIAALWALLILQFTSKIPSMYQLLQLVDEGIFVYKTIHGRENDEKIKLKIKKYAMLFQHVLHAALLLAAFLLVVVTPLLIIMFGEGDRAKIDGINYKLPVPFWFPFNTETTVGFIIAHLLISGEICLVVFYVGVALSFIVYCALEVGFQFKVLHDSIMNIEPRAVEIYRSQQGNRKDESNDVEGLREDPLFHKCVRECLKENILHHIQIVRYFNLFQNVTSPILGVSIGVSMIFLASLSLVLTKIQIFSFEAVKFTFFFFLELCFAFGYCFMGTSLTEASKQIPNALYNCPWFKLLRNEEKKILLIFEMNTENSLVLKGNGLFVIDLKLFVQIARTTYSIFNIFSSREK